MVCRHMDSFDYYSTSDIIRKWQGDGGLNFSQISSAVVRTGATSLQNSAGFGVVTKVFDDQASWVVGFAFHPLVVNQNAGQTLVIFSDNIPTGQCFLFLKSNGILEVRRSGTSVAVAGGASSFVMYSGIWYYVEMKVTIANSIGANTCQVRINGVEIINVDAGEDLQVSANATADSIRFVGSAGSTIIVYYDDVYIFDGTGSENNDFIGDVKVASHFPDGNGTTNNFNGSDGNSVDNYLLVDENPTDDDSTYTESSTPGDIDLYTFDDLATTPDTIYAVQVNNILTKTDAGSRTMRSVTRPVATDFFGASRAIPAGSYVNTEEIYDLNPETSLAWTEALFNATEFGIEIET